MTDEQEIQDYLANRLSQEARSRFEDRLAKEPTFKAAFEEYCALNKAIQSLEKEQLKKRFKELDRELPAPNRKTWRWLAASVLVVVGVSCWWVFHSPSNDQLYATYFEAYPNVTFPVVRGGNDSISSVYSAYESKKYEQSITDLREWCARTDEEAHCFYLAISLMANSQLKQAEAIFRSCSFQQFQGVAQWYHALALLKLDKEEQAVELFQQVAQQSSEFSERAKKILKEMNYSTSLEK